MGNIIGGGSPPFDKIDYFNGGYILIADDIATMRKTIKNLLRSLGINKTKEASNGDDVLRTLVADPDCSFILMDWNMPSGMSGLETVRTIRATEEYQHIPIIMVTAEKMLDYIAEASEAGVSGYLLKPFVANTLGRKIFNVLHSRANPPEYINLIKAGEILMKQGKYELALKIFMDSYAQKANSQSLVYIGEVYEKMGNVEKALENYERAVEKNRLYLRAYIMAANLYMATGNDEEALVALENALKISPRNFERRRSVGRIHLRLGNIGKAKEVLRELVKLHPEKSNEIAEELLKTGYLEIAEEFFRRMLSSNKENIHIYNRLGITLRKQGKWQEAVYEYKKALKFMNDDIIYYNMGKSYLEGGEKELAITCFEEALKINPDLKEANDQLEELKISHERIFYSGKGGIDEYYL